jgi:hypothetical protein
VIPKNRFENFEDLHFAFRSRHLQLPDIDRIRQDALNSKHLQKYITGKAIPKNSYATTPPEVRALVERHLSEVQA